MSISNITNGSGLRFKDMTPEERKAYTNAQAKRRMRHYRKKQEKESVEKEPVQPESFATAMEVCEIVLPKIKQIVAYKQGKASWYTGSKVRDDIESDVLIGLAEAVASSKWEEDDLIDSAEWLANEVGLPNVDKSAPPASKWIISVINRQANQKIIDIYRNNKEVSLEYLEAATDGGFLNRLDDIANFKADQPPGMIGWRPTSPGALPQDAFAIAINAAIKEKGLDWLTDLILDNLLSNGLADWSTVYEQVLLNVHHVNPDVLEITKAAQVSIAKLSVESLFGWLPKVVVQLYARLSDPTYVERKPAIELLIGNRLYHQYELTTRDTQRRAERLASILATERV
jgi:hypothetical protein